MKSIPPPLKMVNVYSFSEFPTDFQPSGSCNFSLINDAILEVNLDPEFINFLETNNKDIDILIYCRNYNILRFMSGLPGLVFNNKNDK